MEKKSMTTFQIRLRNLRKMSKENQDDVAKLIGVTRSNYSHYELKGVLPPVDKLLILCKHWNVSLDYLMGTEASFENQTTDVLELLEQIEQRLLSDKVVIFDKEEINMQQRDVLLNQLDLIRQVMRLSKTPMVIEEVSYDE